MECMGWQGIVVRLMLVIANSAVYEMGGRIEGLGGQCVTWCWWDRVLAVEVWRRVMSADAVPVYLHAVVERHSLFNDPLGEPTVVIHMRQVVTYVCS